MAWVYERESNSERYKDKLDTSDGGAAGRREEEEVDWVVEGIREKSWRAKGEEQVLDAGEEGDGET